MTNDPKDHWVNMPDFDQPKKEPFLCINLRFETEWDMIEFTERTGIKLTSKTKSAWFPDRPHSHSDVGSKRWR